MKITNKLESFNTIKRLKLNRLAECNFKAGQTKEVIAFINNNPAKYYAIRDKSGGGGKFKLAILKKDVLKEIEGYSLFSINISSFNYVKNQLLVGEIFISGENISFLASTNSSYSLRDAYKNPDYNFNTTIYDDTTLNKVPYFDKIFQYVLDNNLENIIVEFAIFNKPVGIYKQNIIIYELRTDY